MWHLAKEAATYIQSSYASLYASFFGLVRSPPWACCNRVPLLVQQLILVRFKYAKIRPDGQCATGCRQTMVYNGSLVGFLEQVSL